MEWTKKSELYAVRCMRTSDGFWIRISDVFSENPSISKGRNGGFRDYHSNSPRLVPFGESWATSDALIVQCWSRRSGLSCKHYNGLSFSLGRTRGYRIYYTKPGYRPRVNPFFRTAFGVWCGLSLDNMEPATPGLVCWTPSNGLVLGVSHGGSRGSHYRDEQLLDYRPKGFSLLNRDRSFAWRCKRGNSTYATDCSTRAGKPVFNCKNLHARLVCKNSRNHGFWVNARSFYAF